ncbi:MAG: DUF87 domain-containing protein [Bacilli bacterium]|nr:DUF87 domain-containing protein [Bacilli bacterium]
MKNKYEYVVGESNGSNVSIDILKYPSFLVTGSTGSGKSVFIDSLLAKLLNKNNNELLNLAFIDTKQVEFCIFKNSKYLYKDLNKGCSGIANNKQDALALIDSLVNEAKLRKEMFETYKVQNFDEFNRQAGKALDLLSNHKMPLILLIVDDYADLHYNDNENNISKKMEELSSIYKDTGIVVIVSSQRPNKNIFNKSLIDSFSTHICFALTLNSDSKFVLGNNDATKLNGVGKGIIYNRKTNTQIPFQSPYISKNELKAIIIRRN